MKKLAEVTSQRQAAGAKRDGALTFDKLADVYLSGTKHDEDQPVHLVVHDTSICATRCRAEYGNPCQHFCPGGRLRNGAERRARAA